MWYCGKHVQPCMWRYINCWWLKDSTQYVSQHGVKTYPWYSNSKVLLYIHKILHLHSSSACSAWWFHEKPSHTLTSTWDLWGGTLLGHRQSTERLWVAVLKDPPTVAKLQNRRIHIKYRSWLDSAGWYSILISATHWHCHYSFSSPSTGVA